MIANARELRPTKLTKAAIIILCGLSCLSFSACATKGDKKPNKTENLINSPLTDIGLVKKGVPSALAQITNPYAYTEGYDCEAIAYQLSQLNEVLGPEEVKGANFDDRSMAQKSGELAGAAASDAVTSAVKGIIPARGIVRKLSGAEKAEKELNKATELGKIRRGFLRGLSAGKRCPN